MVKIKNNIQEDQIKIYKTLIGLISLAGLLLTQDPPANFTAEMVDHQSIQLNWDVPVNDYVVTTYISDIEDDGAGNLILSVFMQNDTPIFGFNFTISSTVGDISINNAFGGMADSVGMSVLPLGYNTVMGSGDYPIVPDAEGNILVYLTGTYNIDNIGTIATIGQDSESLGFISGDGGYILHQWHPVIWQIGIGSLSNPECTCEDDQTYFTCPFDCDIPVVYNLYRDNTLIVENMVTTSFLDEGLEPETMYCYAANAVNPFSTSELTEEACVMTDCITQPWFEDLDQDGLGDPAVFVISCGYETPENFVGNNLDEWPDCPNVEGLSPFDCNGDCFNGVDFNGEQMSEEQYLSELDNYCMFNMGDAGCSYVDDCGACCDGLSGTECSYWLNEDDFGGAYDCNGICDGSAYIDECEQCCSGSTGVECSFYDDQFTYGGAYDCNNDCFGDAEPDDCGICNGDGSTCVPPTTPENVTAETIDESQINISWDQSELPETNYATQDILAFVSEIETIEDSVLIEISMINAVPIAGFSITLVSSLNALVFDEGYGFGGLAEDADMQVTINNEGHILAAINPTDQDIPVGEGILTKFWAGFDITQSSFLDTLNHDTLNTAFSAPNESVIPHSWMETIWEVGNGVENIGFCGDGICSTDEAYLSDSEGVETCPGDCPPPITYTVQRFIPPGGGIETILNEYEETIYTDTGLEPEVEYCYQVSATAQYIEEPKESDFSDLSCTTTTCIEYTWYEDNDNDGLGDPDESMVTCDPEPPPGYVGNDDDLYPYCFENYYDCMNVCGGSFENDIYGDCCDQSDIDLCGICFGDDQSCEGIEPPVLTAIGSDNSITLSWTSVSTDIDPGRMPLLSATVSDVQDNGEGNMVFELSIDNSGNDIAGFSISFDTGGLYVLDSIAPLGGLIQETNFSIYVTSDNIFTDLDEGDGLITESGVLLYVAGHYDIEDINTPILIDEGFPPTVFVDGFDNVISDDWVPTTWLLGTGLIEGGYCGDGFCEEGENYENCPQDCGGDITYTIFRVEDMIISGWEDTSYVDSEGLIPDSVYCYTVTATNQIVTSLPSNEACASIDCELVTFYSDIDGDGLGDPDDSMDACEQPPGFVENDDDPYPECYYNYYDCAGSCGGNYVEDTNGDCCDPDDLDTCGICFGDNACEGYCGDGYCGEGEDHENCPDDCEGDPEPGGPMNLIVTGGDHQIFLDWTEPDSLNLRPDETLQVIVNEINDDGFGNVTLQVYMTNPEPITAFNFTLEPEDILTIEDIYGGSSEEADMNVNWLTPSTVIVMESDEDDDIPPGSEVLLIIEASYDPGLIGQDVMISDSDSPFNGFLNDSFEIVNYDWIPVNWSIGTGLVNLPSYCGDDECNEDEDEDSCPYDCNVLSYIVYADGIVIAMNILETSFIHTGLGAGETHCYIVGAIIDGVVIQESNEACTTTNVNETPVINSISDQPGDDGGWVMLNIEPVYLDTEPNGIFYEIFREFQGNGWISVGTFGAYGWDEYFAVAPTIADSTAESLNLHAFKVTYQGIESDIFYGYSVNNNPPDAPTGLTLENDGGEIILEWNANTETDFQNYFIYSRIFGLEWDEDVDSTTASIYVYEFPEETMEYAVTAVDSTGNESGMSNIVTSSGGLSGDVNQDGTVDVLDIIRVVYFILELETPTSYEFWAGDINGDESLDILDVVAIVNIILGDLLIRGETISNAKIFVADETISITADGKIAGAQIEYTGDVNSLDADLPNGWNIYYNESIILIFTIDSNIPLDNITLNYTGELEINSNIITSHDIKPISAEIISVPNEFILYPNFPNPFNPVTKLHYALPFESIVRISVFDIQGREVSELVNESQHPGDHFVQWNGEQLNSGVYFVRLRIGQIIHTQKVLLLK